MKETQSEFIPEIKNLVIHVGNKEASFTNRIKEKEDIDDMTEKNG